MRIAALALLIGSCTGPTSDAASTPQEPVAQPVPAEAPTQAAAATPGPANEDAVPKLGRDHRSVVACETDADCGWDNGCTPTRCVEAGPERTSCDKSWPPPGACSCVEKACTLKPKTPPAPSGKCEIRGCVVDRAAGTCVADTEGVPENIRSKPGVNVGPSCDCPNPDKGCAFTWFDAVPCKTDRDCWIDPSPRRHPVARPKALRKRDFQPCKDGEVAPKCGPAGACVIGPAYGC